MPTASAVGTKECTNIPGFNQTIYSASQIFAREALDIFELPAFSWKEKNLVPQFKINN